MINNKTTAVRLIPAPGKTVGDTVEIGGLFGEAPVDAGARGVERGVHRPRRPHPRPAPLAEELNYALPVSCHLDTILTAKFSVCFMDNL